MKRKIMSLFLSLAMIGGMALGWTNIAEAAEIEGFQVEVSTADELAAGQSISCDISIKNTTDQTLTTSWINNFYYQEYDNDGEYPGVEFGTMTDESGAAVSGEGVEFAAGETKNFTLTGKVPETWGEKSQITIVVGSETETDYYYGQADYPMIDEPGDTEGDRYEDIMGDGADKVEMGNSEDVFNSVFTEEELAAGKDLYLDWIITSQTLENIEADSMQAIEDKAGAKKIAMLLDIALFKSVGEDDSEQVTELQKPITITLKVPVEYAVKGRVFTVIREHNGVAEELKDLDKELNTVTISTDKFSYYALAYEDAAIEEKPETTPGNDDTDGNVTTDQGKNEKKETPVVTTAAPETGDVSNMMTPMIICAVMAGIIVTIIVRRKKMA